MASADRPMNEQAPLFDDAARARNFARVRHAGYVDFLQMQVADEIQERLAEVNRPFKKRALITDFAACWPEFENDLVTLPEATLKLEPESYDLVIHALALHAANDPVGQLIQMRRALRPDGMGLVALFGGQSLIELREALTKAEVEISGGLRPRVSPMAEIRDLGGLLQRAGFALPVADSIDFTVTYENLNALMHDLRGMGESNVMRARGRGFTQRRLFERAEQIYRERFATPEGRLEASVEVIFLTGWAPDQSQQKPLKPGSAQMRLSEALGQKQKPD